MYSRNDQGEYYNSVLLPLEKDVIKRKNTRKIYRQCKRTLKNILKALKARQFGKIYHILRSFLKDEYILWKNIKKDTMSVGDIPAQQLYFSDKRVAVYTAVFGKYDRLQEPRFCPDNVDYFVYTDGGLASESKWKKKSWEEVMDVSAVTGTEKNRFLKMFPHLLFPEYEYSVYIDGNIEIRSDFTALALKTEEFPIAMHLHKDRDCVYEEIDTCIEKRKDTLQALSRQKVILKNMGIPTHWGLLEAPVIARRHHDPVCKKIMEKWWECFMQGCRRDQIALIRCLWELEIDPAKLGGLGKNVMENSKFDIKSHMKI